ncbi:MAG: (deoxy)nucleoside triphosphate pyrophosphohydrolase [Myxococcota bacterium]|nr:(deoxy)nucleoside triphosphate pyrophosphohydrolase [Myxococcota bacterium]
MIVVAAAVIREAPGAPILMTRRMEGAHLAGLWEFPGGKVERGEDPEHAVVRECREEIALDLEVLDILEVAHHVYAEKEVLLLFYDCRVRGGAVQHLGVADHAWVLPSELERYPVPPPDARLIEKLVAGR